MTKVNMTCIMCPVGCMLTIEKNRGKNLTQIEPQELATKINQVFARLNSNTIPLLTELMTVIL